MDITDEILHQHGEQRRMFALLDEFPKDDVEGLAAIWRRLEIFLETHAEGEEKYFYPALLKLGTGHADADSAAEEVEDAVKDHNEIRHAAVKASSLEAGTDAWWEAVTEPGSPTTTTWPRRSGRTSPTSGCTPAETCATTSR